MASQIATHVTVVYHIEIGSLHELTSRFRAAAERVAPFHPRFGSIQHFGPPERGIFIAVHDIDHGWQRLRAVILGAAAADLDVAPHVTIVHPRTNSTAARDRYVGAR